MDKICKKTTDSIVFKFQCFDRFQSAESFDKYRSEQYKIRISKMGYRLSISKEFVESFIERENGSKQKDTASYNKGPEKKFFPMSERMRDICLFSASSQSHENQYLIHSISKTMDCFGKHWSAIRNKRNNSFQDSDS